MYYVIKEKYLSPSMAVSVISGQKLESYSHTSYLGVFNGVDDARGWQETAFTEVVSYAILLFLRLA